jgi:hypothetical protein
VTMTRSKVGHWKDKLRTGGGTKLLYSKIRWYLQGLLVVWTFINLCACTVLFFYMILYFNESYSENTYGSCDIEDYIFHVTPFYSHAYVRKPSQLHSEYLTTKHSLALVSETKPKPDSSDVEMAFWLSSLL